MRYQMAALECWNQGKHRESATNYWLSFREIMPQTHEARYHIFHGYTSTLRGDYFETTDDDIKNIEQIFRDKHEPRLFRLEAGYTLGVIFYDRCERLKCQEIYHHAITIGEKPPKNAKQERLEQKKMLWLTPAREQVSKTMKELMDLVLDDCRKNLNGLNRSNTTISSTLEHHLSQMSVAAAESGVTSNNDPPVKRTHTMPIGRGGTSLTDNEINNLLDVGGFHCDCCKHKGGKLLVCSGCKKAYYCSAECQKKQWKENGHKMYCRKDGEFRSGDLVQVARLKNKTELNHNIMRVVGPDKTTEGRYELRMEGAVAGDKSFSIASGNLNQLRPYDCRK